MNAAAFIEAVYNEKRVHSGIGYLTPSELEKLESTGQRGIELDGARYSARAAVRYSTRMEQASNSSPTIRANLKPTGKVIRTSAIRR